MENTYDNNTSGELKIQYNLECILKFYFFTTNIDEFPNSKHKKIVMKMIFRRLSNFLY